MSGLRLAGTISPSPRWVFDSNRWQAVARQILILAHVVPPMVLRIPGTIWARRTPVRERGDPTLARDTLKRVAWISSNVRASNDINDPSKLARSRPGMGPD